jgi:hypothetical protein
VRYPSTTPRDSRNFRDGSLYDDDPEIGFSDRGSFRNELPSGRSVWEDSGRDRSERDEFSPESDDRRRRRSRSRSPEFRVPRVPYKKLLRQMEVYLGEDLPHFSISRPTSCHSALRTPLVVRDEIRPLPISPALSSAILASQKKVFGFTSTSTSSLPPLHFVPELSG